VHQSNWLSKLLQLARSDTWVGALRVSQILGSPSLLIVPYWASRERVMLGESPGAPSGRSRGTDEPDKLSSPTCGQTASMPGTDQRLNTDCSVTAPFSHSPVRPVTGREGGGRGPDTPATIEPTTNRSQPTSEMGGDAVRITNDDGVTFPGDSPSSMSELCWKVGVEVPPFLSSDVALMQRLKALLDGTASDWPTVAISEAV
jgi:hypothetical protein